eukprot:c23442_g2_i1 orf=145-2274(-)
MSLPLDLIDCLPGTMDHTRKRGLSPKSSQASQERGWERFLPERTLRVLLVEDDISTRQVVCALLSKCGYEVSCATDGLKAWDLLEQTNTTFDLVLADAMMPVLSGTDLLVKIMSSEAHRDIPVIMMSSHDSLDMVFKCLLKGAKDFLVKPLRKNELRNLWQHVWRRNHASGGAGGQGDVQGKKRKMARNVSFGDASNDNFSVSSGTDDQSVRKDESNAQISGGCQSDTKLTQSNTQPECNWVLGSKYSEAHCKGEPFSPSRQRADSLTMEDSEASARSAKAFDFIGTMATEPVSEHNSLKIEPGRQLLEASLKRQASPALELTLRRTSTNGNAWCEPDGRQGVHQSNYSAFSKYTGNISSMQQQCVARSASLPSDQGLHACGPNGNTIPCVEGSRTTLEMCGKENERAAASGNCSSTPTLHFPKATHFYNGRHFGNSPLSLLSSCCDENGRQIVQDNALSNFSSPSLNSTTALQASKETFPVGNKFNAQKEAHLAGSLAGSIWCSTGSDKEDHSSNNNKLSQLSSCTNVDCEGLRKDLYTLYNENLHSKQSEVDGFANAKRDAAVHDLPTYTMVSGRGSNDGSDRGSNLLDERLMGKSVNCTGAQDRHSMGGHHLLNTSENSMVDMDCSGPTAFDEGNVSDVKPPVYDYRNSFREAVLYKFREKRKMRCFDKKVRYQSRKKLAEQRPRVKGQFVRRAVYDPAAEVKATT